MSQPTTSSTDRLRADFALRSERVVVPGEVRPGAVLVAGGRIAAVTDPDEVPPGVPVEDLGGLTILPGLLDTHVHINEPGRTEWEGFATATRAAAAGGITTLVDMPLNSSPVTTTAAGLRAKLDASAGKLWTDVGFYGGVVPGNTDHLRPLIDAGVLGFKAFLCHSGIDEFPDAGEADLRAAMPILADAGLPLLVHAELVSPLPADVAARFAAAPRSYAAYLATRPPEWETAAIGMMIRLCRETGCRTHIVHLATAAGLGLIREADEAGLPISAETCPHYLYFAAEDVPDADTRYKCAPPIRSRADRRALCEALLGTLATVGSDHSPAPPELKQIGTGDLSRAWGGISSLQLLLPATLTALGNAGVPDEAAYEALTIAPADLVGLAGKGRLAAGADADMVVLDPDAEFTVAADGLHHRHKVTPYEGHTLRGKVLRTYLRGRRIYDDGRFVEGPAGRTILRGRAS